MGALSKGYNISRGKDGNWGYLQPAYNTISNNGVVEAYASHWTSLNNATMSAYTPTTNWAGKWDNFNNNKYTALLGPVGQLSKAVYGVANSIWTAGSQFRNKSNFSLVGDNVTNMRGQKLNAIYGKSGAEWQADLALFAVVTLPMGLGGRGVAIATEESIILEVETVGISTVEEAAVHGNSLLSTKPTWGYKLFSSDGTFLKNGITNKLVPETRYTRAFMSDKYMEAIPFPNRIGAYQWEFGQNQILRGPLNFNMH